MNKIVELTQAETEAVVGGLSAPQPRYPLLQFVLGFIRHLIGGGKQDPKRLA